MEKSDSEARYDDNAKDITAEKIILAHILVATMEEYKGLSPDDVIPLIEGNPEVRHESDTSKVSSKITGMSTVLAEAGGGRVELDIRFFVWTPDRNELNEKSVKIIANVEIQNKCNPGYDISKRQVFSACRMISNQKNREFTGSDYDNLKKVSSIWIFTNPKKVGRLSVTEYKFAQFNRCGNYPDESEKYNMINIINIGLPKDTKQSINSATGIHKLLGTLYSKCLSLAEKKQILEQEFSIKMNEENERRVGEMCNLSLDIRQDGIREGIREGETSVIRVMLLHGYSEEAIINLGFTNDDINRARQGIKIEDEESEMNE